MAAQSQLLGLDAAARALRVSRDTLAWWVERRVGPRPHVTDAEGNGIAWTAERITAWRKQQQTRARGERQRALAYGSGR